MRIGIYLLGMILSMSTYAATTFSLFSLTSPAFQPQATIPTIYTCEGKNISPELTFNHAPATTKSFALVISDPDAPKRTFYHWVIINIPNTTTSLPQNVDPVTLGAIVLKNTADKNEYMGPCPPKGSTHTYIFTLYALNSDLTLPKETEGKESLTEIKNHAIATAELKATYGR